MVNYRRMFEQIHGWLRPGGTFVTHAFCHREAGYAGEDAGPSNWMSRYFFSGGMMPSDSLPLRFQDHLKLRSRWRWSGAHYARTCRAWLANMGESQDQAWPVLEDFYGGNATETWWMRWRMFFKACEELCLRRRAAMVG